MEAFATVDDLEKRWRPLEESERTFAETALLDATAMIANLLKKYRVEVDPADDVQEHNLRRVTCNVVMRTMVAMQNGNGSIDPYTQQTVTAGVFSQTYMYANPNGDFYLRAEERRSLGIGRMRLGSLAPECGTDSDA
jgi:hypothetical protein